VHETDQELCELDELLERSFATAGPHLTGIISEDRRLSASDLSRYLVGVKHVVVATTTARGEPRCSAVDVLFVHGRLWFSTSSTSVKIAHLERRPALSVAHVVGDDVGVFAHGSARIVRGATDEAATLGPHWQEVYGGTPEDWVETPADARYVEVVPHAIYSYAFSRDRFESMLGAAPDAG
jgi:general stress protein 26